MPRDLLEAVLEGPFSLTHRPEPLPGDLRVGWGIAVILLILDKSRGRRASMQKLHFLAHAIRTQRTRTQVQGALTGTVQPSQVLFRVEPWVNRALALGKGAKLLNMPGGRSASVSALGSQVLEILYKDDGVLVEEKRFLDAIAKKATETNIERIVRLELPL